MIQSKKYAVLVLIPGLPCLPQPLPYETRPTLINLGLLFTVSRTYKLPPLSPKNLIYHNMLFLGIKQF